MTTKQGISDWFDAGVKQCAMHMLVICDSFDYEDYPVYTMTADDCRAKYKAPGDMQRVMEVYDLRDGKARQLALPRTLSLPTC